MREGELFVVFLFRGVWSFAFGGDVGFRIYFEVFFMLRGVFLLVRDDKCGNGVINISSREKMDKEKLLVVIKSFCS